MPASSRKAPVFSEPDLIPLSALQHLVFCERQCALIHLEGVWTENRLTVEGRHVHDRVDDGRPSTRDGVRTARSLPIRSLRLGLVGKADTVEFHPHPFPVEYKRGRPKSDLCDKVQLCAQALCLEEMLALPPGAIPAGALFYARTRRRLDVPFDADLRAATERAAARAHELLRAGVTPRVPRQPKCDNCSLIEHCFPDATSVPRKASRYVRAALQSARQLPASPTPPSSG